MVRLESAQEFIASMPSSYREAFDDEAMLAHAGVAARREASATRVEIWKDLPERVAAICIAADDRPGLLSQISAALVAHDIDVITAHAYCRARGSRRER
jgi:UTP:GlnB (protein PII) uridylyltransferase